MQTIIHVLIVDDNKYLADIMGAALALQEDIYVAGICNSGSHALDFLQKKQVDIMLLDIIMPELDGMQVLARMKERNTSMPSVILLTAIGSEDILQKATELGADDFLTKPADANVIVQKIRSVYRRRHQNHSKLISESSN